MRKSNSIRVAFALFAVCVCMALLSSLGVAVRATSETAAPSNIRVTPPAPVFDDKERVAELVQRRERVAKSIGPQSIMILFSTEPRIYTNDVDYPYRQENNLYYLTQLKQKGATLVLLPGNTKVREILFMPRRNAAAETWTGHMYSPEEANQLSGIREIWNATAFIPFIKASANRQPYRPKAENICMSDLPADVPGNTKVREILFMPRRNAAAETWTGHMYSPEEANQLSGIREIWNATGFDPFIKAIRNRQPYRPKAENIFMSDLRADMPLTNDHGYTALFDAAAKGEAGLYMLVPGGERREYRQEQGFAGDSGRP